MRCMKAPERVQEDKNWPPQPTLMFALQAPFLEAGMQLFWGIKYTC